MLVLALVWWAWSAFVWAANAQDTGRAGGPRLCCSLAMVAHLHRRRSRSPHAFGERGDAVRRRLRGRALPAPRALRRRVAARQRVVRGDRGLRDHGADRDGAARSPGAFDRRHARRSCWTAAAAIDYAGPAWLTRERLRGLQQVAVAHFAERYSLFIIICLGESIVAIGVGASEQAFDAAARRRRDARRCSITIGAVVDVLRPLRARAEERCATHHDPCSRPPTPTATCTCARRRDHRVRGRRQARGPRTSATRSSDAARLALCGGVALYLVGHAAFRLRLAADLSAASSPPPWAACSCSCSQPTCPPGRRPLSSPACSRRWSPPRPSRCTAHAQRDASPAGLAQPSSLRAAARKRPARAR